MNTARCEAITDDATLWAQAGLARLRAEIELLASIADSPRQSFTILRANGVTFDSMVDLDTSAIYLAIEMASSDCAPRTKGQIATAAVHLLGTINAWDDTDQRRHITTGIRWGPGPLVALLCRVGYDPAVILAAVQKHRAAVAVQDRLLAARRKEAA